MSEHKFCRARPVHERPCPPSEALEVVQELLNSGTASLPVGVRTNLYNLEAELQVLKNLLEQFPPAGAAARRQQPAAKDAFEAPEVKKSSKREKKEHKKDKKRKETATTGPAPSSGKDEGKKAKRKRLTEAGDADGDGDGDDKTNRKAKKQKQK